MYEVIVGNVGLVYQGTDQLRAVREYLQYCWLSLSGTGRVASEDVTLMRDGEPILEHTGVIDD